MEKLIGLLALLVVNLSTVALAECPAYDRSTCLPDTIRILDTPCSLMPDSESPRSRQIKRIPDGSRPHHYGLYTWREIDLNRLSGGQNFF